MATYFTKNDAGEFVEIEVDDAKELKDALTKERDAHKTAKERAKELENLKIKLEEDKLLKEKEFEKLWNQEKQSKELTAKELAELKAQIANKEREALASKIISPLTKNTTNAELLKMICDQLIQTTPDGIKIFGKDGMEMDEDKLVAYLNDKYPQLIDGVDSTGGGAKGSKSSGFTGKKWSDMTEAEHVALYKKDKDAAIKLMNADKKRE